MKVKREVKWRQGDMFLPKEGFLLRKLFEHTVHRPTTDFVLPRHILPGEFAQYHFSLTWFLTQWKCVLAACNSSSFFKSKYVGDTNQTRSPRPQSDSTLNMLCTILSCFKHARCCSNRRIERDSRTLRRKVAQRQMHRNLTVPPEGR